MILRLKYILLFFCFSLFINNGYSQDVKGYELSIDKDTILIGDYIRLSVKMANNPVYSISFPTLKDTIVPGVELVRDLTIDTIRQDNQITEFVKQYIITSFDSGNYALNFPLVVQKSVDEDDLDTIFSNTVEFTVNTIPIDTLTYQMFDIKAPIKYPLTFAEVIPWVLLAILVIALVVIAFILYRRWKNKQPLFGKIKPKIPPHILAFKELNLVKTEKLWQQGKVKIYYTRVTDILRVYIENRFAISTMEKTSDEILSDIKKEKIDDLYSYDKLSSMLHTSDLVKFAKYQPSAIENENTFNTVFEFVTNTQPEILDTEAQEKKDKDLTEKEKEDIGNV